MITTTTKERLKKTNEELFRSFLERKTVVASSDIVAELTSNCGMSATAARKAIQRFAKHDDIWRSENLKLRRGERLFAIKSELGSAKFFRCAGIAMSGSRRPGISRCLLSLADKTVLSHLDLVKLLAVPCEDTTKRARRKSINQELVALQELGCVLTNADNVLESVVLPNRTDDELTKSELLLSASSRQRKERLIASIIVKQLQDQGVIAWSSSIELDMEKPYSDFNSYMFTGQCYSYLRPLLLRKGDRPSPCPVLIDVVATSANTGDVEAFVERVAKATHGHKTRSLPILAAKEFSSDAWKLAKKNGLWVMSLKQTFGETALDAMTQVEELVNGLFSGEVTDSQDRFDAFSDTLETLKVHPVVSALRSIGFEVLAGLALYSKQYQSVELNRQVPWLEGYREIDAFGVNDRLLYIIECKASRGDKSVTEAEVKKFFTETVPALKKWLRENNRFEFDKCKAEIWTTGNRGQKASDCLAELSKPKSDEWKIRYRKEVEDILPASIKSRGIELISTISKPFERKTTSTEAETSSLESSTEADFDDIDF